jgi:hypothetical protein
MRTEPVYELVRRMSALEKLGLLQLLRIASSSSEVQSVVSECNDRGFGLDRTLAEVLRRHRAPPGPSIRGRLGPRWPTPGKHWT